MSNWVIRFIRHITKKHSDVNKENNDFADRRVFARLPVKLPLRFLEIGKKEKDEAQTLDISANGIGFISKKRLAPNTPLEMWLQMPEHCEPLYITGKVIWSKNSGNNQEWRIGVIFEKVNLIGLGQIYYYKNN